MVHVRGMRVIVRHRGMTVRVGMRPGRRLLPGFVGVLVMGVVVRMAVFMDELRMVVHVPM